METRVGDWIQTYMGLKFYPLDPRPEDICIEDIAHSLSLKCRFAGHCNSFYTVGQHSLHVSWLMEMRLGPMAGLCGLMHDSAEAYVGDLPRPLKRMSVMKIYGEIEDKILEVIFSKYCIHMKDYKWADNILLATEKRDLLKPLQWDWELPEPLDEDIMPKTSLYVEQAFLNTFHRLMYAKETTLMENTNVQNV